MPRRDMRHSVLPIFAVMGGFLVGIHSPAHADETPLPSPVDKVLQEEATTTADSCSRRRWLDGLISREPDLAAARWQAGYVRDGDDWLPVEMLPASSPLLDEYRRRRAAASGSAADQLALAAWCARNRLTDQEQAHLTLALSVADEEDRPAIRRRLGYRLVHGQWMSRREQDDYQRSLRGTRQAVKRYVPRLQDIARRLDGSPRQRATALDELKSLDDPGAITAALVLAVRSEEFSDLAMTVFRHSPTWQATQALAHQALFSPRPPVQWEAVELLKARKLEEFVPALLASMRCSTEAEFEVRMGTRGALYYRWLSIQETANRIEVVSLRTINASVLTDRHRPLWRQTQVNQSDPLRQSSIRNIQRDIQQRLGAIADQTEAETAWNSHVGTFLTNFCSSDAGSDPRQWWEWWQSYADAREIESKNVVIVDEDEVYIPTVRIVRLSSCLTAGTPVWTETGFVPVEQVRPGDRVLAKDVETGELAYQPVLTTTVRQATQNVRLRVDGDMIELTGGHPVWVSGAGWTKARDLVAGTPLHTATGMVRVEAIEPAPPAAVYNLVVADFSTYFFGRPRLLSHDVTTPRLTNTVVPGLAASGE